MCPLQEEYQSVCYLPVLLLRRAEGVRRAVHGGAGLKVEGVHRQSPTAETWICKFQLRCFHFWGEKLSQEFVFFFFWLRNMEMNFSLFLLNVTEKYQFYFISFNPGLLLLTSGREESFKFCRWKLRLGLEGE